MSYGIRIYNEHGQKLIDSDREMFHLHSEQNINTSVSRGTVTLAYGGLQNRPIVLGCVVDGQAASVICRPWKSGTLFDRVDVRYFSGTLSKTIRVWIFARGEGGAAIGYGIRVFRADGSISFESSRIMVRHHSAFSGSVAIGSVINHDFTELNYPPPIGLNRIFLSWWTGGFVPPAHYTLILRYLHWRLLKNALNNYYRLEVGLTDVEVGVVNWSGGYRASPIDYSGFIFKYK